MTLVVVELRRLVDASRGRDGDAVRRRRRGRRARPGAWSSSRSRSRVPAHPHGHRRPRPRRLPVQRRRPGGPRARARRQRPPGFAARLERRVQRRPADAAGARARASGRRSTPASTSPARPSAGTCSGGNWVRVTISSTFTPVTPLAGAARRAHPDQLGQRQDRMTTRSRSMRHAHRDAAARHVTVGWPVLVVFALSLITLLGFAGLALDGGSTFAQRRSQQTAADMAALAAANDYLDQRQRARWRPRAARRSPPATGSRNGTGGTTVATSLDTSNGIAVTRRRSPRPTRTRWRACSAMPDLDGHDHGDRPRRLPGHGLRRVAVHLRGGGLRSRRDAAVPDADRLRREQRRRARPASSTSPGRTTAPAT